MSRPSKVIVPAVGVSCSRINFEVVVFPQPDSPMSPGVSPAWMAKSTVVVKDSLLQADPRWRRGCSRHSRTRRRYF